MATVLIVDDDKHTRALLERALRHDERISRHGVRVVQASDGLEGLRVYDQEQPDVVITDLLMPRMDGFRFCKELRTRANGKPLGILVLSGVYRDQSVSLRLRDEVGAALYTKPYQIKDLVIGLDKHLDRLARSRGEEDNSETVRVDAIEPAPPAPAQPRTGRFDVTSLGRVLLDLHEERATGTLELRRGGIEKRIDLVVGHPVAVTSNQRGEMLGHFLVMRGVISEKIHQRALEMARDEEKKVGEALSELGVLSAADLVKQLTAQARYKITRALRWPDGEWAFRPNRELLNSASKGNALDPVAVVLTGLKKTASVEQAARALAALAGHRLELTVRGARLRHTIARAFGEPFAEALEARPTVDKLLGPPFDTATTMPALEALLVTGCVADGGRATESQGAALRKAAEPPDVEELSGAFKLPPPPSVHPPRHSPAKPPPLPPAVYEQLFLDESSDSGARPALPLPSEQVEVVELAPLADGVPEEIPLGDSSVIEVELPAEGSGPIITIVGDAEPDKAARDALHDALLTEYLRLQGKDCYAILRLGRDVDASLIETGFSERMAAFSLEKYQAYDMGRDHGKLEELHAAYRRAYETLSSADKRTAYDRELNGGRGRSSDGQMMGAELAFRAGERRLASEKFAGAVEHFRLAVDSSPGVADYHAALGWAMHRAGGASARDGAGHVARALAIDPDHPAAHEYLGRILAAEGKDDETAGEHLERALEPTPPRRGALEALEALRTRRGELTPLERLYRSLLRRLKPEETDLAFWLWRALGRVYTASGDRDAARTAYQTAQRLSPADPTILDALAELATTFVEKREHLRARWRLDPGLGDPGRTLLKAAVAEGRPDAIFVVSAALVARGAGDGEDGEAYRRHRPRFLIRAMRTIDGEIWPAVRHPEDDPELGDLFAVLAPAGHAHAPMTPADLEVKDADLVAEGELSETFTRVRAYVAHMLGVPLARVARRADFGAELHLGALPEPILLAGPAVLVSEDRLALAFQLGRAMSYLWPGRALAGSRPARVLKELFIAAVRLAGHPLDVEDTVGVANAISAVAGLPREASEGAGRLAATIAAARTSVNLSSWSRALARSADRVGLVLCGDPVVAAAGARVLGGDSAEADVLDYALSGDHLRARATLGVSIDV